MFIGRFKVGRCWLYGQYFIVKPCGYIMWHDMLYRSEGSWITMNIWNSLYRGIPAEQRPRYTWTDSGCKLWKYINNRPNMQNLWRFTWWLVDRFHGGLSHNMRDTVRIFVEVGVMYLKWKKMKNHLVLVVVVILRNKNK